MEKRQPWTTWGLAMNKPVAWIDKNTGKPRMEGFIKTDHDIPLYTHPVKELDEQFEKGFKAGKEEGWKAHKFHHPVKEQDESFDRTASHMAGEYVSYKKELTDEKIGQFKGEWYRGDYASFYDLVRAILKRAFEK